MRTHDTGRSFELIFMKFTWLVRIYSWVNPLTIGSVHPSESGTIAAFWGEKGENQLDEKGNVFNTFKMHDRYLFPFLSIITLIDPN